MLRPNRAFSAFVALSVVLAPVTSAFGGAPAAGTPRAESPAQPLGYDACQTTDETAFRTAVRDITTRSLKASVAKLDYQASVGDVWRRLDVGRLIDLEVDKATAAVRDETSWGDLLQSLGSEEKAQALTVAVAERVFRSDAMKSAIENVAGGVGRELAGSIEIATSDAAGPALECLKAFLGPRFGTTVASVVTGEAGREFVLDPDKAGGDVTAGSVLRQSGDGITGAAILVMRRQLANMAQRIGQRIAGSILSRLVSVVAGGVGVVLIAKDVWELRHGVLPIIAGEMKSQASKDKVQAELASTMAEHVNDFMDEFGAQAADRIVTIWREFRAAHTKVLDLAERQSDFRQFLDGARPDALARVDEVTALVLATEGEAGVARRLADGTLDEAVNKLPEPAMEIARQTRSVEQALKWNSVAGPSISQVAEYDIFKRAAPGDFTRTSLARLFSLSDPLAIRRMASVTPAVRDVLFDLDPTVLRRAAGVLDETRLSTLALYMSGLSREPRERLIELVAKSPENLQILSSTRVRDAILSSRDQSAALDMMLRPAAQDSAESAARDLELAWEGHIHPELIWHRHPVIVAIAIFAFVVALLILWRLLGRPKRAKPTLAETKSA